MNVIEVLCRRDYSDSGSDYDTAVDMYHYRQEESHFDLEIDGVPYYFSRMLDETTHSSYDEDEENGSYGPGMSRDSEKDTRTIKHTLSLVIKGRHGKLIPDKDNKLSVSEAQGERLFDIINDAPENEVVKDNIPSGLSIQMAPHRMDHKINKHVHRVMTDPSL